jgi:hypothetical protein
VITLSDLIGFSDLTEAEVQAIARHEHVTPLGAVVLGCQLMGYRRARTEFSNAYTLIWRRRDRDGTHRRSPRSKPPWRGSAGATQPPLVDSPAITDFEKGCRPRRGD